MRAFSSHRGLQDSKMRFLIVCTAILAYANAAPSQLLSLAPLSVRTIPYPAVSLPAAIPTISSGDIQAAAIDAQVKYADLAQAAVDNARQISEQTVENLNLKTYSSVAADQEKVTDALWATEDKKWQALDAIKTAEAQWDGALASNVPTLVKSAVVAPYVAAVAPYSAIAPISPVVYPGYLGSVAKSVSFNSWDQAQIERTKAEAEKNAATAKAAEASVKAAEESLLATNAGVKADEVIVSAKSVESEKSEIEASVKSAEAELETAKFEADKAYAALQTPFLARTVGLTNAYWNPSVYSSVALSQPILKYASPLNPIAPFVGSTYVKTVW